MVALRPTPLPLVLVLVACSDPTVARRLSELEVRTKSLEESAGRDRKPAPSVEERLARVEKLAYGDNQRLDLLTDELARSPSPMSGEEASISCTETGHSFVRTPVGPFIVTCPDLKPFGDGYRLTLLVGNPHLVTLNGFRLRVRYGPREPGTDASRAPRETTAHFTDKLRPGAWSRVRVTLAPCKAEDTGFIAVTMSVDQVVLDGRVIGR